MWKLMQSERFRVRFGKVATSPADVEAAATFSLLALAVKLYVKMRGVPPSFVTATELLLYLEGQRDDEKAALWKRVYRDGPDSARAREELEQAILGHEPTEVLREKLHAFVSTFPGRQDIAERPKCTGIAASWCPVCGDCACPRKGDGELVDEKRPADDCPLHGRASRHAEHELFAYDWRGV